MAKSKCELCGKPKILKYDKYCIKCQVQFIKPLEEPDITIELPFNDKLSDIDKRTDIVLKCSKSEQELREIKYDIIFLTLCFFIFILFFGYCLLIAIEFFCKYTEYLNLNRDGSWDGVCAVVMLPLLTILSIFIFIKMFYGNKKYMEKERKLHDLINEYTDTMHDTISKSEIFLDEKRIYAQTFVGKELKSIDCSYSDIYSCQTECYSFDKYLKEIEVICLFFKVPDSIEIKEYKIATDHPKQVCEFINKKMHETKK